MARETFPLFRFLLSLIRSAKGETGLIEMDFFPVEVWDFCQLFFVLSGPPGANIMKVYDGFHVENLSLCHA